MKKKLLVMTMLCVCFALASVARAELVARYTFDDGTAGDSSGNGLNGTLQGAAAVVNDGERGKVLQLAGVLADYVMISDPSGVLNFGASGSQQGSATVAAWIKSGLGGDWATHSTVFSQGEWDTGASLSLKGDTTPDGQIWINGDDAHSAGEVFRSDVAPDGTVWSHVAVTFDYDAGSNTTQVRMYLNGVQTGMAEGDPDSDGVGILTPRLDSPTGGTNRIGLEDLSGTGSSPRWPFNGMIDDLQVYNTALSAEEIAVAMSGGGVSNPDPANGAIRVPVNKVLSWDPPETAEPNFVITGYCFVKLKHSGRVSAIYIWHLLP